MEFSVPKMKTVPPNFISGVLVVLRPVPTIGTSMFSAGALLLTCLILLPPLPSAIDVLIADSNRMQAQLLTSALRRHPEFNIAHVRWAYPQSSMGRRENLPASRSFPRMRPSNVSEVVVTLRRFHLSHPAIPKVLLVDSFDRELVVSAFRSARAASSASRIPTCVFLQMPLACVRRADLGEYRAT